MRTRSPDSGALLNESSQETEDSQQAEHSQSEVDDLYDHVLQEFGTELEQLSPASAPKQKIPLETIEELSREALSDEEIASALGCTLKQVRIWQGKLMRFKRDRQTEEKHHAEIERLFLLGLCDEEIAALINTTPSKVKRIRHRDLRLQRRPGRKGYRRWTLEGLKLLASMGLSDAELAKRLNLTRDEASAYRYGLKLPSAETYQHIDRSKIRQLHNQGLSDSEIAQRLECTREIVVGIRARELKLFTPRRWQKINCEKLKALFNKGLSDGQIAKQLECTVRDVNKARRRKLGLFRGTKQSANRKEIEWLVKLGWTDKQIADKLGLKQKTIAHIRSRELGIRRTRGPPTGRVERDRVRKLFGLGFSDMAIASELDCSPRTVGSIRSKELGLLREGPAPSSGVQGAISPSTKRQLWRIDRDEIKRLFEQGLKDREIAVELGCSPRTVEKNRLKMLLLRTKPHSSSQ